MDKKPVEAKTPNDEGNNQGKGEADTHDQSKVRITTQPVFAAPPDLVNIDSVLAKVPTDTLGLFIINTGDLVFIERAERVTLGRHMEDVGSSVSVDLTPYGGAQSGVSRRHALILIYQAMYLLQDLGSTNGTWLNAVRLPPHSSHMLRNGDMIQLGQIRMQVIFHGSKPGQGSGDREAVERTPTTTASNSDGDVNFEPDA